MKKILIIPILLALTLHAREVVDDTGICKINWTQGNITCEGESAEGQSKFAAKISAKVIAQRNLIEVIKGVNIDSEVTVSDGMLSSDIIKSRVSGVVKGAQVISNIYDRSSRSSVATLKLEMGKDLLSALLSDPTQLSWNEKIQKFWSEFSLVSSAYASTYTKNDRKTIEKLLEDYRQRGDEKESAYLSTILQSIDQTGYSGILIDIRNVNNFQKAMMVKLVDENGEEVYPLNHVSRETLLKKNTSVGFMFGLNDARENKRVFNTPLEIQASGVYKQRRSDIILTKNQIESIKGLDEEILSRAKIILVLGD